MGSQLGALSGFRLLSPHTLKFLLPFLDRHELALPLVPLGPRRLAHHFALKLRALSDGALSCVVADWFVARHRCSPLVLDFGGWPVVLFQQVAGQDSETPARGGRRAQPVGGSPRRHVPRNSRPSF